MKYPVYKLSQNAAFEAFDDGALILNLHDLTLTELNITACEILTHTDGNNDVEKVARLMAATYGISLAEAQEDVQELYQSLFEQGILEVIQPHQKEESYDR